MSAVKPKLEYKKYEYPSEHWSMSNKTFTDFGICVIQEYGHSYAVFFHPKTRCAYRLIVQLIAPLDDLLITTFNRRWTPSEISGFYVAMGRAANLLEEDGLIGQSYVLGNGSQSFDEKTRTTTCGKKNEPCLLHGHIFFRGDPKYEYIKGIELGGINPGFALPVTAHPTEESVKCQLDSLKWEDGQKEIALEYFKARVIKRKNEYNFKLIDNTKPFKCEDYANFKTEDDDEQKQEATL